MGSEKDPCRNLTSNVEGIEDIHLKSGDSVDYHSSQEQEKMPRCYKISKGVLRLLIVMHLGLEKGQDSQKLPRNTPAKSTMNHT